MIKLDKFRLVNVHANNGTMLYPDVTFNLNGENTLLDAKNGGGKTLAVQMLFQTILPNSYFDENKTIKTLFINTPPKTTMHTVASFQLGDTSEYSQLCLGIAISKSQEFSNELNYFNYIIESNDLDIDTLKLNPNGKAVSIGELKRLLQPLEAEYRITTFENQLEEYTQALKQFDINAQVYRFIMNINQTENYIQQYFEKHCSTQQGLLTEFIIPNTISALDDKKASLEDDISILAQSLLEKSKSLSELKSLETQLEEYNKVTNLIDTFLHTLSTRREDFTKYERFLGEYSKQYTNFSNLTDATKSKLSTVCESIESTQEELTALDERIEYLITRSMECDVISTQEQLKKSEEYYTQCENDVTKLQESINNMLATNSVVEYKSIETQLALLEEQNIPTKELSAYANTIYAIADMQVKKTLYEMEYVQNKVEELNSQRYECIQNIGRLKNLTTICEDNVRDWTEKLNTQLISIESIQSQMLEFKKYGDSLLESEELFAIVDSIKEVTSKLEDTKAKKSALDLKVSVSQSSVAYLEKSLEDYNEAIRIDSVKKSNYENEVKLLKSELNVEEFEFETKYDELKHRQIEINVEISKLSGEIQTYKDEISTMKQHGILREKSRYDALQIMQNELESAYFGSEMLQSMNNIQLLEKFPALAEVVLVSDKDYNSIKRGDVTFPEEVLRENFVIMPYSIIRNINKLTFSEMLCLTRNAKYYQSLMDTKAKIEDNDRKILSSKYKIDKLNSEYDSIQSLCNRIITHVSMYSFDVMQGINERLETNSKTLDTLTQQLNTTKETLSKDTATLEEYTKTISTLEDELNEAESKKSLLDELIKIISESHKNQVSITNEKKKAKAYESNIKDLELELTSIQSKVSTMHSDLEQQNESMRTYKAYILEVENYVDTSTEPLDSKDIELLIQQFRAVKNNLNLTSLDNVKPILTSLLSNIKGREVFTKVDFNTFYSTNNEVLTPYSQETINRSKHDLEEATQLLKNQRDYIVMQNNSLEVYLSRFDNRLNAEDTQYDEYRNYSISEVENLLDTSCDDKNVLNERLRSLNEQKTQLEQSYSEYLIQSQLYKFFCLEKHLDLNTPCDNTKLIDFSSMAEKYNLLSNKYRSALEEVNLSIKKLSKGVDELKISEQIKYTIKNNAITKQTYLEVNIFADRLKHLKSQAEAMVSNLKTTIGNLGRIDEDISEQLYRVLAEILDEVSAIPKVSKCKFDDTYKETFKINLYVGGKGCRFPEDKVKKSIKKYILELARDITTKYYDKHQIVELLSINKIIRFGIDMNRLNIQILKVDLEKPTYQNWENVIASTGQEYIMYVMFTITMVKYFNNVMGNSSKSPLFIFLDNPFASASDVQLWQPVRKFLDKNDTQLLCSAHSVPTVGQILFENHIILEQSRTQDGKLVNTIRNQKRELKENTQLSLFDSLE